MWNGVFFFTFPTIDKAKLSYNVKLPKKDKIVKKYCMPEENLDKTPAEKKTSPGEKVEF